MKKMLCILCILLLALSAASAEEIDRASLVGTWRFCGGAEVMSDGFTLYEDGSCTMYSIAGYEPYTMEWLLPREGSMKWQLKGDVLTVGSSSYPIYFVPERQAESGNVTIHLSEGPGGGFYERCSEDCIVSVDDPLPDDVYDYIILNMPGYLLEDYLIICDTPEGDYSFALLDNGENRALLGFEEEDGGWGCWLTSSQMVPQQRLQHVGMYADEKGITYSRLWDMTGEYDFVTDGLRLTIYGGDGEYLVERVAFAWQEDAFYLTSYQKEAGEFVDIVDGSYVFYDISGSETVFVPVQSNMEIGYVNFASLPATPEEARKVSTQAGTADSTAGLTAELGKFPKGKRYSVYMGPGKQYQRSGNGKAVVSTNDWIQVFGEYDGWLLIQYGIDDSRCRIGWINAASLADVPALALMEGEWRTVRYYCELTDDPLWSRTRVCDVAPGDQVELLAELGDAWAYVRYEKKGKVWLGFVRQEDLQAE